MRPSEFIQLCWLAGLTIDEALYQLRQAFAICPTVGRVTEMHILDIYTMHYRNYGRMERFDWETLIK